MLLVRWQGVPTGVEHTDGMDRVLVRPSGPLMGEVVISGAKNSALKLMAATLLAPGEHVITNVPQITDVATMTELLGAIGVEVVRDGTTMTLRTPDELHPEAPYHLVERMRASTAVLGPLLTRVGRARVALPGGDDFGSRPIDMHLSGLEAMGATFELEHGYVRGSADGLRGASITLEFPSVGATENIVMAAVVAKGTTVIDNAAREPEIGDLVAFLTAMGAQIDGAGTATIVVEGTPDGLRAATHETIPDRVEAATYLAAVAVTGGEVVLRNARADHMEMYLRKLGEMGVTATPTIDGIWARGPAQLRSVDVSTLPYPGRRDRLQAAVHGDARDRRWRGHRDREPVRRTLPLRRRTGPDGSRHPHRRPPCRRARKGPALRGAGARTRHPGRSRARRGGLTSRPANDPGLVGGESCFG